MHKNAIFSSLLSEAIGSLIEDEELMNELRNGELVNVKVLLEETLLKFYQRKVLETLE